MGALVAAIPAIAGAGSAMSAVSVATGLVSMVGALQQGRAQQKQADYQASIAELEGRRRALGVNEELLKVLAMNNAAAAAGGLQSAGTVVEAQKENIAKAEQELAVIGFNTNASASAARQSGDNAMASAWAGALNTGVGVLGSAYNRVKTKESI